MTRDDDYDPEHARRAASYQRGLRIVFDVVRHFRLFRDELPQFNYPDGVGLIASLDQAGPYLARNQVARDLLAALKAEFSRRKITEEPTAAMLLACLEDQGIAVVLVPFEALGIPGELLPLPGRGRPS